MIHNENPRASQIIIRLTEAYGTESWNWHTQQTPFQILIGTVLSQRTKDEKTDQAAKALFAEYPSPDALSNAPLQEIEKRIRSVNFYKTKAARIKEISRIILERHAGKTPESVQSLMTLPGVGIKTASCVMVYGFRKAAIPVDTHVHRISNRLGLIRTKTPEETEKELWSVFSKEHLLSVNELMVKHGQTTCKPITPLCYRCPVSVLCRYTPKTTKEGRKKSGDRR